MDLNESISNVIKTKLSSDPALGAFEVQTRVGYDHNSPDDLPRASLTFLIKNPLAENDPARIEKHILATLASLEPFKAYVQTETETSHMKRLADELERFRQVETVINTQATGVGLTTIPDTYSKWFEELPKRKDWNIFHALNVSKDELGIITLEINVPKDVDPAIIIKNFEARKDAIMSLLADRAVKYTEGLDTQEKKDGLKQLIKNLHVEITASSNEWGKSVAIQLASQKQRDVMKEAAGKPIENPAQYVTTNPLMALKDGDGEDKAPNAPPPHLKKALARAFLHADESKAMEIFPLIAGKDDMRRAVAKQLVALKKRQQTNTQLCKDIDTFLADDVFINPHQWDKPVEEQKPTKSAPSFGKPDALPINDARSEYNKGVLSVKIDLPADKFPEIQQQLANINVATLASAATTVRTNVEKEASGMSDAEVCVGAIQPLNQQKAMLDAINATLQKTTANVTVSPSPTR